MTDISIVKVSVLSLDMVVGIRVDNPNDFDLDFSKLHYQLVAAGLAVASGFYDPHVVIKARTNGTVRLPLSIDAAAALLLVRQLVSGKEDVTAVMTAVADFETAFGAMTVDFEDKRPLRKLTGF